MNEDTGSTAPSDSPADRIAEIRARVEALNAGDDSARYAARAVLEVNAPSDIPWLLEQLGVEKLVAKLADENFRIASAKAGEAIDALLRIAEAVEPFDAKRVAAEALDTIAKLGHDG